MLALALILGLIVWVLITLAAIFIGTKLGKSLYPDNPKAGLYGALSGFMLTMGGFIAYWAVEYVYIQSKVNQLCESEGGVTVYVTPEEYRAQIGEEEWADLSYTGDGLAYSQREEFIIYKENEYYPITQTNQRIWKYHAKDNGPKGNIYITNQLLYDIEEEKVLYVVESFTGRGVPAIANSISGLKIWLDNIEGCNFANSSISAMQQKYSSNSNK